MHRLGDDYIVPKWRLADQVADIVRSPSGNSIREIRTTANILAAP